MRYQKTFIKVLALFLGAAAFAPLVYTQDLLFPFITTKAFFFRFWVLLSAPLILWLTVAGQKRVSFKNPIIALLVAYLAVAIISGVLGVFPGKSMWSNYERMTGVFYLFTLTLYMYGMVLVGKLAAPLLKRLLGWHIIVALLSVLYGFYVGLGGTGFFADPSLPRLSSMFGNPIFFASFLIVPISLCLFFMFEAESRGAKVYYGLLAAGFLLATLLTGTRGALVGWAAGVPAGLVFVLLVSASKKVKRWSWISLVAGIVALVALYFIGQALPQGNALRRITQLFDANASSRLIQWQTALRGFSDNPILGVGPENYNVIANFYYDARQYAFDRSWFDKPHNYLLEVLTTTGLAGFVLYIALYVVGILEIRKAVRKDLISAGQGALLVATLVAYTVQNLFVFDTISASITIFTLFAFLAYLHEAGRSDKNIHPKPAVLQGAWAGSAALSLFVLYGLYATVFMPYKAAVAVNYGYAYARVDAAKASEYFTQALNAPFQFDRVEVVSKFAEFASGLVSHPAAAQNVTLVNETLDKASRLLEEQLEKTPRNAILAYQLTIVEVTKVSFNQTPMSDKALAAIARARQLAPQRPEIMLYEAQMLAYQGKLNETIIRLEEIIKQFPAYADAHWRLALARADQKNFAQAIEQSNKAFEYGYKLNSPLDLDWQIGYYTSQKNTAGAVEVLTKVVENFPQHAASRARLAQAHLENGDPAKARELALSILTIDPNAKADVDAFLARLPK